MQIEMNQLLEMQTAGLNEKVDEAKRSVKDGEGLSSLLNRRLWDNHFCCYALLLSAVLA